MPGQIDEIKERLDIVQVVSGYLQLKKVGANYRALCPFHSEKTPSFYVSPARQIFKCFGCGASGSIFDFVMKIEGLEFSEALQFLARRAGVEIKKEPVQKRTERQRQYEICEFAAKFFEKQLEGTKTGKEAMEYLKQRGISEGSIKDWRVGYAPDTWRGLSDFLVSKGYKREEITKAGLAVLPATSNQQPANSYDRFRGRIMFPIFDIQRNVVGFGGRIFKSGKRKAESGKPEEAKYINTPNTFIYDKSRILYGLNRAKMDIREGGGAILVEGYTDVILSHQAGVKNVVATSGTALTPYQLKIISRLTKNLLLAFDMDIGGEEATKRGIDIAQYYDFNIKIISLPEGKDPADVINENYQKWQKAAEEAEEIINFYFKQAFNRFDKNTAEGKKKISSILLPFISRVQNKIEQAHFIRKLSEKIGIEEKAVWEEIKRIANKRGVAYNSREYEWKEIREIDNQISEKTQVLKSQRRKIEERLLMWLLYFSGKAEYEQEFKEYMEEAKGLPEFSFGEGRELLNRLGQLAVEKEQKAGPASLTGGEGSKSQSGVITESKDDVRSKNLANFVSEIEFQVEIEKGQTDSGTKNSSADVKSKSQFINQKAEDQKDIQFCIDKLKEFSRKEKIKKIAKEIQAAEGFKDNGKISKLLEGLRDI